MVDLVIGFRHEGGPDMIETAVSVWLLLLLL